MDYKAYIEKNSALFWDIKSPLSLSETGVQERIMLYGDWRNIQDFETIIGKKVFKKNYLMLRAKKRFSFPKQTTNFFNLYLHV